MAFAKRIASVLQQSLSNCVGSTWISASLPSVCYGARLVSSNLSKVYVGGLPFSIDEEKLKAYFSTFGNITDVVVVRDHDNGRSRGFAFAKFSSKKEALAAVQGMDGMDLCGRIISVRLFDKVKGARKNKK